jgi:hypothetical protein
VNVTLDDVDLMSNSASGPAAITSGAAGSDATGGAVSATGSGVSLVIVGSSFTDNTASGGNGAATSGGTGGGAFGGAIYALNASVTVEDGSTFNGNSVTSGTGGANTGNKTAGNGGYANGGAIDFESSTEPLSVTDSSFVMNTATGGNGGTDSGGTSGNGGDASGGAIEDIGSARLAQVSVVINDTDGGNAGGAAAYEGIADGGGIASGSGDALTVEQSAINNNAAVLGSEGLVDSAYGGGIEVEGPTQIVNSTIYDNQVVGTYGSHYLYGGGIDENFGTGTLELANDTLDYNSSAGYGGNFRVTGAGDVADTTGTIFANGRDSLGYPNCSGTVTDTAPYHNLEYLSGASTSECGLSAANGDLIGVDPMLGALANNGGQTETLALDVGSPAIGADPGCIDPTSTLGTAPLTVDQRGLARSATACDIGAFQSEKPAAAVPPSVSGNLTVGSTLTCETGTWTGDGSLSYSYAWNGTTPAGATGSQYVVRAADVGHQLSCSVTAHGTYGTTVATSAAVSIALVSPAGTGTTSTQPSSTTAATSRTGAAIAPVITGFSQANGVWRRTGRITKHAPPVGTTFRFSLNEPATVTLMFTRVTTGHRGAHSSCLAGAPKRGEHPCNLSARAGALTASGRTGKNTLAFTGRVAGGKTLKSGRYTVTLAAGTHAASSKLTFKIAS